MKLLRNNNLYVELSDINILDDIPNYVYKECLSRYNPQELFIEISNEDSICYLNRRESIIDYDSIHELTDGELDKKIQYIEETIERLMEDWTKIESTKMRKNKMKVFKHKLTSLFNYKTNREKYDRYIKEKIEKKPFIRIKENN